MNIHSSPPAITPPTDHSKTNNKTSVAAGSFVFQPYLSPRTDEDIPFYEDLHIAVKVENVDMGYGKTYTPSSDHSSSDLSQTLDREYDAEMDIVKNQKEVIDACHLLAIPTGNKQVQLILIVCKLNVVLSIND